MKNKLLLLLLMLFTSTFLLAAVPTTPSPAQYAVGVSILPTLSWTNTANKIQFGTDATFGSTLYDGAPTSGTTYVIATPLSNATTYYWRASADAGTNWSATWEFISVNAAKPTLNPIYPGVTSAYIGWYPVPYSSGLTYDVYVSSSADDVTYTAFSLATGGGNLTNTYYTLTGLVQGTYYKVQVRAKKSTLIISYSAVSPSFRAAGPPVPTASYPTVPAADGSIYANPPTLFWYIEGNEPTLAYEIELYSATDPNYSTVFSADQGTLIATGFTSSKTFKKVPLSLIAGKIYTWHVRSVSGSVRSNWSATATFTMYSNVATAAEVPTPSWPVTNPTVYLNPPTLYWYLGSDKTGLEYQVQFSTSSTEGGGAGTGYTAGTVTSTSWTSDLFIALPTSLITGTQYFWHVRSKVAGSSPEIFSAYSSSPVASFTIAATASGAATTPIPSWPVGGAIVDGTMADITLSWTAYSTQALDFTVRIATSSSVDGSGMLNHGSAAQGGWVATLTSANANAIKTLTAGATYYWQVKSKLHTNTSVESPWSMIASFSTAAGSSSVVPLVISPNYLQPLNNTTAVLTWHIPVPSESHLKYDLQYSKNADFNNAVSKTNLNEPVTQVTGLETNSTYYWRVLSKTDNGSTSSYSTTGSFTTSGATAVEEQETIPTAYELSQNYPNPFNPTTRINFAIPQNSFVTIKVYDMLGREVKTLINQQMVSGNHSIDWNADNNLGIKVATGMYIYRITAGNFVSTKKMVLIK